MSVRSLFRLRSVGLRAKPAAKPLAAVAVLMCCFFAASFATTARRSAQAASIRPAPTQRRLVAADSDGRSSAQSHSSPATPNSEPQALFSQQAVHLASRAFRADQQPDQLPDSAAEGSSAASVQAAAPGGPADPALEPSGTSRVDAFLAPSGSGDTSRSAAPQPASTSPDPADGAAPNVQGFAAVTAPMSDAPVHRGAVVMPQPRSRIRIGAAANTGNAATAATMRRSRRLTPEKRLRAFEWLFGPKEAQSPPMLSPVAAAAIAHDRACAAFYRRHPQGPTTVAVVGNGPLSEADRDQINSPAMDVVMRFNRLNNWCAAARVSWRA